MHVGCAEAAQAAFEYLEFSIEDAETRVAARIRTALWRGHEFGARN